jgi:HAD superfamily hydrolase (TIGR01509 family)
VDPILASVGAGTDPHCWVAWGEEPGIRHTILVPTDPVSSPASSASCPAKGRGHGEARPLEPVSIGDLAIEAQGGHRLVSFQAEQQVLRGVDAEADRVAAFALRVIAAIDGGRCRRSRRAPAGRHGPAPGRRSRRPEPGRRLPPRRPRRREPRPRRLWRRERPTRPRADRVAGRPGARCLAVGRRSIAGVIFDLDGVIVDLEIWWDEVRQAFAADHDRSWTVDDRHAVMGANSRQWSETMRRRLELDLPAETIERAIVDGVIARYRREGAPTIDGAVEAVRRIAAALPVALASSSHPAVIAAALAATDLEDTFQVVVSSDEVSHGKPAPDVFLEAARRLGSSPAGGLVVEDSLNGLKAGRAAGMTTVLVLNHRCRRPAERRTTRTWSSTALRTSIP